MMMDKELETMHELNEIVAGFSVFAQERIINWLMGKARERAAEAAKAQP